MGEGVGVCRSRVLGGGAEVTLCSCEGDLCNITAGARDRDIPASAVIVMAIILWWRK